MSIVVPTAKVPAETQYPKNLILFGLPKVGKTTILSTLENNLILDFPSLILFRFKPELYQCRI